MRIDVHNHLLPDFYVEAAGAQAIGSQGSSGRLPVWDVQRLLRTMDEADISTAITSFTAPGVGTVPHDRRASISRQCNEFAAQLREQHPGRFGMFATLPLPDIEATLREIEYCYKVLHCEGVCLLSNYAGRYLGESAFDPVYSELERRHAVVFIHPTSPAAGVSVGFSPSSMEFPFDTTRTSASLMVHGVLRRFPSVRFILSHGGGALPYIVERLDLLSQNDSQLRVHAPSGFAAESAKFYVDMALSTGAAAFAALCALIPMDHILFGTDFPFGPPGQAALAARETCSLPLSATEQDSVAHTNARDLFPQIGR